MTTDVSATYINGLTARYRMGIKIVLIVFVLVLLTFLVLKFYRAFKKPANATYVTGGGAIPQGWDPKQLTTRIFDVIDGVLVGSGTMEDVFGDFNKLNDNQMIAVYNSWMDQGYNNVKKYFVTPLGTLTNAIKDKIGYFTIDMNQKDLAVKNLERLHLT